MEIDALWDFFDAAASERRFRDALSAAADESDRLELETQLARALGLQRRFDEGFAILDSKAFANATPRVRVRAELERGRLLNSSGLKADSVAHFIRAAELAAEFGAEGLEVDALHMLAIADAPNALDWNERALAKSLSSLDPAARKWQASLLNNLGWTYFEKGQFERSLELFERALSLRREKGDAKQIAIAEWCVGRLYRALGRFEEARQVMLRLEAGDSSGYVHEELAELYAGEGDYEMAREAAQTALEMLGNDPDFIRYETERLARLNELAGHISE